MFDRLEQALFDLGDRIAYPPTPVFEIPTSPRVADRRPRRGWLVAAAVAAALLILMAFPGPRAAVANLFGIGSVALTTVDELPASAMEGSISGTEVTLEQARAGVDFPILGIDAPPDVIFHDPTVPGGMVTLVYGENEAAARLLLTQLQTATDLPALEKLIAGGTGITSVTVGGDDGFWIEGDPHAVILFDRDGKPIEESARLAGNTLLFTRDGLTIRIEGDFDLDQALEIGASLQR